jgi:enoyl-CoA hydratase/carnithine racemase
MKMLDIRNEGQVAILTINRPQRRNALSEELIGELKKCLQEIETNPTLRATVITGCAPGFCAGSDLKELATMDLRGMCDHEADTGRFCRSISQMRKPIIASVEGFALGGGFVFAATCDIVVTSASCRWHLPEVKIGWIPPWGLEALVARLGPVAARRFAWGGEEIVGIEAYRVGLADYIADDGTALDMSIAVAQRLAALPDVAVASTKAYFAPHVGRDGEIGDINANRMFEENCKHPVAQATLMKFGVRV